MTPAELIRQLKALPDEYFIDGCTIKLVVDGAEKPLDEVYLNSREMIVFLHSYQ